MRRSGLGSAALVMSGLFLSAELHADSGAASAAPQTSELTVLGKPLSVWVRALREGNLQARVDAADALGDVGPAARNALPALADAMRVAEGDLMDAAHRALLRIDPDARIWVQTCRAEIKSTEIRKRLDGVFHLGCIADVQFGAALTGLLDALHDEAPMVRMEAARWLGRFAYDPDAAGAVPALAEALRDPNASVRGMAAYALSEFGKDAKTAVVPLANALADPDEKVREDVFRAMLLIDRDGIEASALPVVFAGLENPDPDIRFINAILLAQRKVGGKRTVSALCDIMLHGEERFPRTYRSQAALMLANMGLDANEAVPAILLAMKDSDEDVRGAAADALKVIDPETANYVLPPP